MLLLFIVKFNSKPREVGANSGNLRRGDSAAKAESFAAVDVESLLNEEQRADAEYKVK